MTGLLSDAQKAALDAWKTPEEPDDDRDEDYDEDAALSSIADDQRKADKEEPREHRND